ncbi:MAG: DUF2225 domain-containing protein [Lachnospiraceae bacterium]|nr:DUF2225 domain-containing protein [Lachnospiraceae bacterium]
MGLFSGLEVFGLKINGIEIYEKPKEKDSKGNTEKKVQEIVHSETDYLFQKTYKCPVCDEQLKSLTVKSGKLRAVGHEDDLRPIYKELDPIKYEPVVCPSCGYASLAQYFDSMMPLQAKRLRADVESCFSGFDTNEMEIYSYDDAIIRYKMVLYCDVIGIVKNSRKAYTCLKMAWVIRGKLENEGDKLSEEERESLKKDELECIQNAYDGYRLALSTELFPISGMDETTLTYLLAELAFRLEDYREALQLISRIIGSNSVSSRIKNMAIDLKEQIRAKVSEEQ